MGNAPLHEKMKELVGPIQKWNCTVFGDINVRTEELIHRLDKVDKDQEIQPNNELLIARRKALFSLLQKWLTRKERYWRQLSRVENRTFKDQRRIKKEIVKYLKRLYQREITDVESLGSLSFVTISRDQSSMIESVPDDEEIKAAVWDYDGGKTPDYDGFNFRFVKKCWGTIGEEILAERLPSLLPSLIDETMTAFVKNRQILDGALIANEVVHWVKKNKRTEVLLKLDFHKAYNSVMWESVIYILKAVGFASKWRKWIYTCLSTASISIL
ncbi:uncharacterized protein LOC141628679 [Silene latifolia]|uniref:uncharacterized protein LOC141628679 n=1 Tax=Silene latifolia TaxID=37657 RepID=UPI003D785EA2